VGEYVSQLVGGEKYRVFSCSTSPREIPECQPARGATPLGCRDQLGEVDLTTQTDVTRDRVEPVYALKSSLSNTSGKEEESGHVNQFPPPLTRAKQPENGCLRTAT